MYDKYNIIVLLGALSTSFRTSEGDGQERLRLPTRIQYSACTWAPKKLISKDFAAGL